MYHTGFDSPGFCLDLFVSFAIAKLNAFARKSVSGSAASYACLAAIACAKPGAAAVAA